VVRALGLQHSDCEFDSWPPPLVLGWMTVLGCANHLGISPSYLGQLSLLLYMRWEMSTGQNVVMLCCCGADMAHSTCR